MKYKTIAVDSGSELARLFFSWDMKKHAGDHETIRAINNFTPSTERMNTVVRRCKDLKSRGMEMVIICHEGIDKIYAKGGAIGTKGQPAGEPAAIKGRIDVPGSVAPEEMMRAADNIFRVRMVNSKPVWIANAEGIPGSDGAVWQVKDRFNAQKISGGLLPPSYAEIEKKAKELKLPWHPPYVWIIYGGVGFQKTRSLLTFPRPILILDVDRGTSVIEAELTSEDHVVQFNSEESNDYARFILELESAFEDPSALSNTKSKLGVK